MEVVPSEGSGLEVEVTSVQQPRNSSGWEVKRPDTGGAAAEHAEEPVNKEVPSDDDSNSPRKSINEITLQI